MCNAYEQHVKWVEYTRMMRDLELGVSTQQSELDLPQSDMVRINDLAPVMRSTGTGIELAQMNFSIAPNGPKGGPVFNFRSEGRDFSSSGRCLIPASGFFEYTGKAYPKTKHRFTLAGSPFLAIAGLWREAQGNHPMSFTMLTTWPGSDIEPFHNRQVVALQPRDWAAWLCLTKPQEELLRPLPAGSLEVETVRAGSD
jgi:putative SOS response-associated peptidase YedK